MPTVKKVKKVSKLGKLGKFAGAVNTVFSVIPDTVGAVGKIVDKAAPLVEKQLDRHHEHLQALITLPNVIDLQLDEARKHLENLGLVVTSIKAKPDAKFNDKDDQEVVAMSPKSGKYKPGFLIKLYFVDTDIIEQSKVLHVQQRQQRQEQKEMVNQTLQKVGQVFTKKKSEDDSTEQNKLD